jgi:hypothetical protein
MHYAVPPVSHLVTFMANPRASTLPLRASYVPTRDLILARRKEYLALCEIAQDSAQLEKYLRSSLQQQALMRDGGASKSYALFWSPI